MLFSSCAIWFMADFFMGGKRGVVARYLMPCWIVVITGLGIVISKLIKREQKYGTGLSILLLALSFEGVSVVKYLAHRDWWTTRPPQMTLDLQDPDFKKNLKLIVAKYNTTFALLSVAFYLPGETQYLLVTDFSKLPELQNDILLFRWPFEDRR